MEPDISPSAGPIASGTQDEEVLEISSSSELEEGNDSGRVVLGKRWGIYSITAI